MSEVPAEGAQERRRSERMRGPASITIEIPEVSIDGPSQDISDHGIYCVAQAVIPVRVMIRDRKEVRQGTIIRIEAVREGEIGLAIRFS